MSVKVGSMIMVGFREEEYELLQDLVRTQMVGGVIFFRENIGTPQQLKERIHHLKSLNPDLLVSIDQEGGRVQRLRGNNGFEDFLGAQEIAEKMSPGDAEQYYESMAILLEEMGFNVVFGPVVDVNPKDSLLCPVIGELGRSYSDDPDIVTKYAQAFIEAHRKHGVLSCLKHFPGHGSAQGDTHQGLVDVTDTWKSMELEPFKHLSESAPLIMSAHIINRKLDDNLPATLSPKFLKNILRKDIGYKGVVISDDLHMGAILSRYTFEESTALAAKAGIDILLFSFNPHASPDVISLNGSLSAVYKIHEIIGNTLTEIEIDESYQRIQGLKDALVYNEIRADKD
jgi:beta-N-acetylhexosaminidase